jgi:hypothetical protein
VVFQSVRDVYPLDHPRYEADLLAIVSPKVVKMLPLLTAIGYKVVVRAAPVRIEEVENKNYRDRAPTSGCCGLTELIKLEGFTLVSLG